MLISGVPPLQWDPESLGSGILAVRKGIPLFVLPGAVGGMSGPITLAGCLSIKVAQCLFILVLAQIIHPGAEVVYAGTGHYFMDMRSGDMAMASAEDFLMTIAGGQMADFYGLPSYSCSFLSLSKKSDLQTGAEKIGGLFSAVGSGVSATINAGMLAGGTIGSLEQMVIDHEMLIMARRLEAGITVNKDTLAFDVIREAGAEGNFINTDHTLNYLRSGENIYLTVFDRSSPKAEYQPLWERAHLEVERILGS
jgi:trimethylamine--corrinoid protein Co-methyltransferase